MSKKYLRWCRRSRRIEWYPSWPPSFLAGQYLYESTAVKKVYFFIYTKITVKKLPPTFENFLTSDIVSKSSLAWSYLWAFGNVSSLHNSSKCCEWMNHYCYSLVAKICIGWQNDTVWCSQYNKLHSFWDSVLKISFNSKSFLISWWDLPVNCHWSLLRRRSHWLA